MAFRLGDDGTFDTVLVCEDCGAELRYNYDGGDIDAETSAPSYDAFVERAIEDANDSHICGDDE